MSIQSPTGILDVTNATLRAGKLESTGDITCSSNLVVSGGFDLSAINSNADTVVDFTATRQLRKYPREILTSDSQNGYIVTASENTNTSKHKAFNENTYATSERWVSQWASGTGGRYNTTTGLYDGATYDDCLSSSSGTPEGEWLAIQVPEAFVLHSFEIVANSSTNSMDDSIARGQAPRDFQVWASNDGSAWTKVFEIEDADAPSGVRDGRTFYTSGVTVAYNRYALIVTRNGAAYPSAYGADVVTVGELRYYGFADGDGQDVRLRAHANAPNTDFLEVHFDANVVGSYPGSGTTLTDLSGEAHHATLNNGVGFDSTYGALTFNGSNQNVNTQALGISGDFVHTASLWIKPAVNQSALSATDWSAFFYIGEEPNTAATQAIAISYRKDELRYWFGANDVDVTTDFKANEWVHLAFVYRGGGGTAVNKDVYVNGVKQRYLRTDGSNYGDALNVQSTAFLRLGAAWGTNAAPYQDFNGSIANFRLFKRPLIEAEIHQLYDWEKVRFGRVALGDVVAFRDGSLGVGVAEPSRDDRLVVDGRVKADSMKTPSVVDRNDVVVYEQSGPHDRPLVKYPEVAMTVDAETASGYKGYKVTTNGNHSGRSGWEAFDSNPFGSTWATENGTYSHSGDGADANTSGQTAGTFTANGISYTGHWIKLELVNAIKLQRAFINAYNLDAGGDDRRPKKGVFLGSNDDSVWDLVHAFDGDLGWGRLLANQYGATINFSNISTRYKYILLLVEEKQLPSSSGATRIEIFNIEFYGTEEGDVSTDSTWTSVLNKPGTQHLEVYWDGADSNSYPGAGTEVFDLSGNGVKGVITGNDITFNDEYKAWTFGGTDTRTSNFQSPALASTFSGDQVHSVALWFKCDVVSGDTLFSITQPSDPWEDPEKVISVRFNNQIGGLRYLFWSNDTQYHGTDANITKDIWYHLCVTYSGGGGTTENKKLYLNGNEIHHTATSGSYFGNNLALPSGSVIRLGSRVQETTRFFGSIANFRLFSKALSIEQVKELYAYDAVRFGHRASNSVSVHKGNLGVGVTAPTARLEVAGNERIQEYPPRVMTGHDTYMEGHGVFKAYASKTTYNPWNAFNDTTDVWYSDSVSEYNGNYSGSTQLAPETVKGEYLILEMPYEIVIKQTAFMQQINGSHVWDRGVYYAKCNPSDEWTVIHNVTDRPADDATPYVAYITDPHPYKYFAIVPTRRHTANATNGVSIRYFQIFGTPAPSTLDDGHLTLGKTLTTPRVSGHAAGAETPRAESLVINYDTTLDSAVSGSTVVDTSGSGNNGTFGGNAAYSSSDRSFSFDGSGDYIATTGVPTASGSGNFTHTVSMWFKLDAMGGTNRMLWGLVGENDGTDGSPSAYSAPHAKVDTSGNISWAMWGDDVYTQTAGIVANRWYHCVWTYSGGTTGRKMFLDGVEQTFNAAQTAALNMQNSTSRLAIGIYPHNLTDNPLDGQISNFKLWNVALTADEVAAEYALGRTGKALNVTDTAVCLGGTAPRAQLDVRGSARFDGKLAIGYYGSSDKEALAPLDVRGDFIQSSANGTVSTAARFGSSDGTLHVSSVKTSDGAEKLALQTTIDNKTMDYNIENSWSYGTEARHALCLQPYKGIVGVRVSNPEFPLQVVERHGFDASGYYARYRVGTGHSNGTTRIYFRNFSNSDNVRMLVNELSSANDASDDRIKTDEVPVENATQTLLKLKPQTYTKDIFEFDELTSEEYSNTESSTDGYVFSPTHDRWRKRRFAGRPQKETGLIIQDIWYDAPELRHIIRLADDAEPTEERPNIEDIQQDPDYDALGWGQDASHLMYQQLIPYLIKSNQELQEQIDKLRNELHAVTSPPDAEFPELKARLQTIETQANSAIQILSDFGVSGLMDPIDTSTWPAEATLAVLDARLRPIETGATGARAILDLFGVDDLPEFTVDENSTIESRISALESAGRTAQKTLQDFGVDI